MKKRPTSAKKKKPLPSDSDWNLDTRTGKYFDAKIDPKAQKEYEKIVNDRKQRPSSAAKAHIHVEKNFEDGKFEVGFLKSNGQVGSKFEMYREIETLHNETYK